MEEVQQQTEKIVSFTNELNRRMSESGVTGVEGLVSLYDQLRSALGKITGPEIEWAQGEVSRVIDSLKKLSEELAHLSALKNALQNGNH